MSFENLFKLASEGSALVVLLVFCYINWKELRGVRTAIHSGNNAIQEILVKSLTGELKSYAQWKAGRSE